MGIAHKQNPIQIKTDRTNADKKRTHVTYLNNTG